MDEYQAKTTNAKIQRAKKLLSLKKKNDKISAKQHKELLDSIASLQANISSLEASLSANGTSYTQSQKDLVQNFSTLQEILQSGLNVNNLKDIKQAKEIIVSNLKDIPKPVINTHKTEIPEWLASDKSVQILNDNVIKVVQALIDLEANIKPSQNADEFVPFRRVIRQGNQLVFDDSDWASRSGGGGSGGGTTGGLTDAELRATPVPVSMSSDIEIGAVELKNGSDDTRAEVTAGNALKVDGSAVTQPVSGTVTATPTGTQNVDVTANTIGLATAANQLPDGHNVTVDNGIGASAVPIQDGGNSITVDGTVTAAAQPGVDIGDVTINNTTATPVPVQPPLSGYLNVSIDQNGNNNAVDVLTMPTVTETNSAAIKTAVEIIDNAISGSEMQVDVVGALPAGTNAIGKLSANSGVDIGDVDVTSTVLPTGAGTSSVTSVADTTTSTTLKASNSSRKQIIIQNTSSAILYVKYGATATSSDFTVLLNQNDILVEDRYTGIIDGIWATDPANGAAKVTEIS